MIGCRGNPWNPIRIRRSAVVGASGVVRVEDLARRLVEEDVPRAKDDGEDPPGRDELLVGRRLAVDAPCVNIVRP